MVILQKYLRPGWTQEIAKVLELSKEQGVCVNSALRTDKIKTALEEITQRGRRGKEEWHLKTEQQGG